MKLGRVLPPDWDHVSKYPLAALTAAPTHVPVAIGCNWYTTFDTPMRDGKNYVIGASGHLGTIRGGHCVCLEPALDPTRAGHELDAKSWWPFYNQGQEGSCEGHGHSRMTSLIWRKRFDAVWLYNEARKIDGLTPANHEGTTNRACLEILRTQGHRIARGTVSTALTSSAAPSGTYGIAAYRWATSAQDVAQVLGLPAGQDYVTVLNSWGEQYPERVRMPLAVLDRLLSEDGEAGVITDH